MTKLKIALAVASATAVAGCGSGMDHSSHMSGAKMSDPMFTAEMIPHHQAAIDMAALAPTRAEHPQLKKLAAEIGSAQASEIALMKKVGKENGWDPNDKMDHSGMSGMSKHEMGMDMNVADLKTAKPFDKAFIEMMVPHHEGAIQMANHELTRGTNPEIRALAQSIIKSQTLQIAQMKRWYQSWYHVPFSS
jgi:uncharacterized protein (DUF305 family)